MQSSTAAYSMHRLTGMVAGHKWCVTEGLCELQKPIGVIAVPSKGKFSLQCKAALLHTACTGSLAWLLGISSVFVQTV